LIPVEHNVTHASPLCYNVQGESQRIHRHLFPILNEQMDKETKTKAQLLQENENLSQQVELLNQQLAERGEIIREGSWEDADKAPSLTLNIYSEEPGAFGDIELKLLMEMGSDIALGITTWRRFIKSYQQEERA